MAAFQTGYIALDRVRRGGRQTVKVIHQQIAVSEGGKAIVSGSIKARGPRRKSGSGRTGEDAEMPSEGHEPRASINCTLTEFARRSILSRDGCPKRAHSTREGGGMRKSVFAVSVVVAFCCVRFASAETDCNELAKNMWDVRSNISDSQRAHAYAHAYCSSRFTKDTDDHRFQGSAIVFGQYKSDGRSKWSRMEKTAQCRQQNGVYVNAHLLEDYVRQVSPSVLQAVTACMNRRGLHAMLLQSSDPNVFYVRLNYIPVADGVPFATVRKFTRSKQSLTCDIDLTDKEDSEIRHEKTIFCKKGDGEPVSISFDADPPAQPSFLEVAATPTTPAKPSPQSETYQVSKVLGGAKGQSREYQINLPNGVAIENVRVKAHPNVGPAKGNKKVVLSVATDGGMTIQLPVPYYGDDSTSDLDFPVSTTARSITITPIGKNDVWIGTVTLSPRRSQP